MTRLKDFYFRVTHACHWQRRIPPKKMPHQVVEWIKFYKHEVLIYDGKKNLNEKMNVAYEESDAT